MSYFSIDRQGRIERGVGVTGIIPTMSSFRVKLCELSLNCCYCFKLRMQIYLKTIDILETRSTPHKDTAISDITSKMKRMVVLSRRVSNFRNILNKLSEQIALFFL